MRTRCPNR